LVQNAGNLGIISNTAKRIPAQTPCGHVSILVHLSSTPSSKHTSVCRNNSVIGTTVVGDSVASEREHARVGEGTGSVFWGLGDT
jgi:hypothetical protein